jgi:hypothetical protein
MKNWMSWAQPVILATQKVEIGRITVQSQPEQKVLETPSQTISQMFWFTLYSHLQDR